jgi:hypothetical protein
MAKQNTTKVVTGIVRLSYANIWDPKAPVSGGDPRYSCSLIIPKSDTETVDAINRAIDCAIQEGIGKFGGKIPNKAALKLPLRDGDLEREDDAYKGCWFINANSKTAPQVVDRQVRPSSTGAKSTAVYPGSISLYAFSVNGNKGVPAAWKRPEGPRRRTPRRAFERQQRLRRRGRRRRGFPELIRGNGRRNRLPPASPAEVMREDDPPLILKRTAGGSGEVRRVQIRGSAGL